ncbi:hypothetical protein BMETH_882_0 [methanotrophic bacterial endosymbiont of Bathymodiolus sp.]|nr:hypothetical protein BMETH_882_0 [methanotrophic bacterial endosymbiont of Bathymodiolus sp.]
MFFVLCVLNIPQQEYSCKGIFINNFSYSQESSYIHFFGVDNLPKFLEFHFDKDVDQPLIVCREIDFRFSQCCLHPCK